MKRILPFVLIALAGAVAQQPPNGDVARGKILFTRIGCYQCHGYAGQGGRAGARLVPMLLRSQDLIRYVRRPPGDQRRIGVAEMQKAGRARRESRDDHRGDDSTA